MDIKSEIEQLKKEIKDAMTNQQYWKIQYDEKVKKMKRLEGLCADDGAGPNKPVIIENHEK